MQRLITTVLLATTLFLSGCSARSQEMLIHYGSPWSLATVNGTSGMFLVDTGASMTVIDDAVAQRSGLQVIGTQQVIATTGEVNMPTVMLDSLRFAGYNHQRRVASTQNLRTFHGPGGQQQAGLIGSDFLKDYNVIFDMENQRLRLSHKQAPTASGMRPHPIRLYSGIPQIQVMLGDEGPVWAKFDTGSGYADEHFIYIDVSVDVARRLLGERLDHPPAETARVVSLAGMEELKIYDFDSVRLLGRRFTNVRLVVHEHGLGAFARPDMIIVTGSVLGHFSRVELDFPRRRIWVSNR